MLSCFQCSSTPMGHSMVYKGPCGAKQLVTVGYTHTHKKKKKKEKKSLQTQNKARDPSCVCVCLSSVQTYKHTHIYTHQQCIGVGLNLILLLDIYNIGCILLIIYLMWFTGRSIFAPEVEH